MRVYYSDGFGSGGSDDFADVERFLAQHKTEKDIGNQIHAVWYVLSLTRDMT